MIGIFEKTDVRTEAKAEQTPRAKDDQEVGLTHELSTALTVLKGRIQLLRRRLRRGDDVARLETELDAIEAEMARLMRTVAKVQGRNEDA